MDQIRAPPVGKQDAAAVAQAIGHNRKARHRSQGWLAAGNTNDAVQALLGEVSGNAKDVQGAVVRKIAMADEKDVHAVAATDPTVGNSDRAFWLKYGSPFCIRLSQRSEKSASSRRHPFLEASACCFLIHAWGVTILRLPAALARNARSAPSKNDFE